MAFSGLEAQAAKLADPSTDIIVKVGIIRELGRTFGSENQRDPEYQRATTTVFPILIDALKTGSPVWKRLVNEKENIEHALRFQTLELLHKFTNSELIRPHLVSVAPLLLELARTDTEDMAVASIKMFNELVRASRPLMESHISAFRQFTVDLFNESETYVQELFSPTGAAMVEPDKSVFPKGFPSLKVLSESLVLCNLLYQTGTPAFISQFPTSELAGAVLKLYTLQVRQETEKDEDHMDEDIVHYGPPASIVNKNVFTELVSAQIKIGPFLGWMLKKDTSLATSDLWPRLSQDIPPASIRMLRVMPPESYTARREAIGAIRNLSMTELKTAYPDSMQALLDDRLVLGSVRTEPGLTFYIYSALAETYQTIRPHMSIQQVLPWLRRLGELASDSSLPIGMLTLVSRLLVGTFEHVNSRLRANDVPTSEIALQTNTVMHAMIETLCTRVQTSVLNCNRLMALRDGSASDELKQLVALEQSRTVPVNFYLANDNIEGALNDERFFVRVAAMSFRAMMQTIRTLNGRVPDADVMGRAFRNLCLAVSSMKGDNAENAYYKNIAEMFSEMEPHVFQMVWTTNMEMFFTQMLSYPNLHNIVIMLYSQPATNYSLTALVLRYLVDNLETLLESTSQGVALIIRTITKTFTSVANLQDGMERVLFPHLPRILVDVFAMSARSHDPRNLLSVPFYLFRALGAKAQHGARIDAFHKEIYPLLPEVLDGVNRALELTEDPVQREQLVEIALTTPARLQYLAPYMAQLWRPLVLALGSRSPELLRQGLRTLELAVENLSNIDLLDPDAEPVAKDLVLALHKVLKPGPLNAETAQTAGRILGKIGGRNRRILSTAPSLSYDPFTNPAVIPVEFTSHIASLQVLPICEVAVTVLEDGKASVYHDAAFSLLRTLVLQLLQMGIDNRASEDLFVKTLEGLVSGIHLSNVEPAANELLREIAKALFEMELAKETGIRVGKLTITPVTGQFLDSVVAVLMTRANGNHANARRLIANIIQELHDRGQGEDRERKRNTAALLMVIISKFVSFCWQTEWRKKVAGCAGISVLISDEIHLGYDWPYTKELELCRSIVTALKDMPADPPAEVPEIKKTLLDLIRFCNPPKFDNQMQVDGDILDDAARSNMSPEEQSHYDWVRKSTAEKGKAYMNLIHLDLHSPNKTVRETTQETLALFAELSQVKLSDFVRPMVEKVTNNNIYNKPLRMFSPLVQIGHMESMTYLLNLDPPVVEASEELWRLLNEVVALAEADEHMTHPMNPMHKMGRRAIQLNAMTKAAAIRLVTAAFPISDYFQKQLPIRQRATSLLFQALYSSNVEIKTAAHDGLKVFLGNQNRLPREHLQAGLRPVLMNLADPNKLTVASLEGLARLLGLLTNYFKVEIATKLIDHFKALSGDEILREAAYGPIADNETVSKLVRLLHIFPLLPPAANAYLEQVVALVVETERKIHAASPTPFTPPLSAYLDRFPADGLNILFSHITEARWVQTIRHVVQGNDAPHLVTDLKTRGSQLAEAISGAEHANAALPSILLCLDLAEADSEWMSSQEAILEALKVVWDIQFTEVTDDAGFNYSRLVLIRALYTIWIKVFKISPRVDVLFNLSLIFTHSLETNYSEVIEFLTVYVPNKTSLEFKRQAIQQFVTALDDAPVAESLLTQYLRMIVIPILTAEFRQSDSPDDALCEGLITKMSEKIWSRHPSTGWTPAFTAELLQLTGLLFGNVYSRIGNDPTKITRGGVAKYIWDYLKFPEAAVRNAAALAAARFLANKEAANEKFQHFLWSILLKVPHEGEPSPISRQALDIMLPVMIRSPASDPSSKWDVVISKTLAEEQHSMTTTVNIYRLINRHADQCYPSRELFIPLLIPGLSRLSFQPGTQTENRVLAGDTIDLIINWLRRAAEEDKNEMAVDAAPASTKWVMPSNLKDAIVAYLMRYSVATADTYNKPGLTARHLTQLKTLSGLDDWKSVSIRIGTFARSFETPDNADAASMGGLISNVKVLHAISSEKPREWFVSNAADLFTYSKRAMAATQDVLVESFAPIFERFVETLSFGEEGTELTGIAADVYQWITDILRDIPTNGLSPLAILSILMAVVKSAPSRIEPFAGGLMKLYTKLVKDHISLSQQQLQETAAIQLNQRIFAALEISRISVAFFGEHRKALLHGLVQLAGSSSHADIRRRLLTLTREWVLGPPITFPTAKEKASLLCKMQVWSRFGDPIYREYLNLVYDIYSTPSMARTDLTMRLESSFILGCRVDDLSIRSRFLDLFSENIPKAIGPRLSYVIGGQNWDVLSEFNWMYVVLDMIIGAINGDAVISPKEYALSTLPKADLHSKDVLQPMRPLLFFDLTVMHRTFIALFPEIWSGLARKEQADITAGIVHVLGRDNKYDIARPNLYQTLLGAIQRCSPQIALPPHVLKYLVKPFHAWYEGLEILQSAVDQGREDDTPVQDANQDALAALYAELSEDDYYYGLWRRRSLFEETNAALSYEQNGFYHFAQPLYEYAQMRARQGMYPMSESEYYVWEDHWMLCSEKLLMWDILGDIAASEANADLALECAWRQLQTWNADNVTVTNYLNNYPQEAPTPRRLFFKAYWTLNAMAQQAREQQQQQAAAQGTTNYLPVKLDIGPESEFAKIVDQANQIALSKWIALPETLTMAHVPLLSQFQQVVELKEAGLLMTTLLATNRDNLPEKAHEAKTIFHHWRERLPQPHDDIGVWHDLISWRQHVFHAVNKFYLPLLPDAPTQTNNANTHAHRGHHESAWIINRFAHVARKHGLLQVCQSSLSDIYKLPNIEISEAFLKLREQARCHLETPGELYQGLEVINNTNLMYFTAPQKAEFFAMKGLFLHKLERHDDANAAFGQAVQLDFGMPKAWMLWGVYSDDMHTVNPTDFSLAANAVSCYLQAGSLYKSAKSRPLFNRILWLLSMDDQQQTVGNMWNVFKGEHVYWYWITLIPQLLISLSNKEGRYAHQILLNIAKLFPQALFFQLRSMRDEHNALRTNYMRLKQQSEATQAGAAGAAGAQATPDGTQAPGASTDVVMAPPGPENVKHAWDMADELVTLLKTAHPLLALTMDQFAEQIRERLKPGNEEEVHRMSCALINDSLLNRAVPGNKTANTVSANLHVNARRLVALMPQGQLKDEMDAQLSGRVPTMMEFIRTAIYLRDQYEIILERKSKVHSMDVWSHYLVEFHISRFEKMSVPGQYLEHKDSNTHFVDIKRISTRLERCRSPLHAFRRITLIGHDGSTHTFTVQYFMGTRPVRRDERFMQLTRIFNETLLQKKEARKRNLQFHILASVSLNPNLRLIKLDSSYIGLIDIHDEYSKSKGFGREDPMLLWQEKLRAYYDAKGLDSPSKDEEMPAKEHHQVRLDTKNEVEAKYIPNNVLSNYMKRTMRDSYSLWTMRKQFTLQTATTNFLMYCMFLNTRPPKVLISRETGFIGLGECSITMSASAPTLQQTDVTPFRLTPNIQDFITPTGMEGLVTTALLSLSRGLLEPECDIQKQMWLFVRDDFMLWFRAQGRNPAMNERLEFRIAVADSIEKMLKRMSQMSASTERKNAQMAEGPASMPTVTVVSPVQQLINYSTNPSNQAKNSELAYPWY